jgi:hypothetical protein
VAKQRRRWKKPRPRKPKQSYQDAIWESRVNELLQYRRLYGHCQVPIGPNQKKYRTLSHWVSHQRVLYRAGRLLPERQRRLERIRFDWVSRGRSIEFRNSTYWDKKWERMLARLARFQRRFGHCRVPVIWEGSRTLSQWVKRQHSLQQEGTLSKERLRRLNALGMGWKVPGSLDPRWERSFQRIKEFRRRFGHCDVPAEWAENLNLGRWVVKTRRLRRLGRLSEEKVRRLDEIGFVWNAISKREAEQEVIWSKRLAKLQAFHARHGHWRVPTDKPSLHSLRVWMDNQRISYSRGWLSADRIRRLDALQFPWLSERNRGAKSSAT